MDSSSLSPGTLSGSNLPGGYYMWCRGENGVTLSSPKARMKRVQKNLLKTLPKLILPVSQISALFFHEQQAQTVTTLHALRVLHICTRCNKHERRANSSLSAYHLLFLVVQSTKLMLPISKCAEKWLDHNIFPSNMTFHENLLCFVELFHVTDGRNDFNRRSVGILTRLRTILMQ